jgi:hypothetical protein
MNRFLVRRAVLVLTLPAALRTADTHARPNML